MHTPERFGWDVARADSWVRIAPVGELDVNTSWELERAIDELLRPGVDRLMELVPGPPQIQRIFEVTGTLDALPFVPATG